MITLPILAGRLANRSIFDVFEIEKGAWGKSESISSDYQTSMRLST